MEYFVNLISKLIISCCIFSLTATSQAALITDSIEWTPILNNSLNTPNFHGGTITIPNQVSLNSTSFNELDGLSAEILSATLSFTADITHELKGYTVDDWFCSHSCDWNSAGLRSHAEFRSLFGFMDVNTSLYVWVLDSRSTIDLYCSTLNGAGEHYSYLQNSRKRGCLDTEASTYTLSIEHEISSTYYDAISNGDFILLNKHHLNNFSLSPASGDEAWVNADSYLTTSDLKLTVDYRYEELTVSVDEPNLLLFFILIIIGTFFRQRLVSVIKY